MEEIISFYSGAFIIEICYPFSQNDCNNPDLIYDWMTKFGYFTKYCKRHKGRYNEIFLKLK